jgi:hypothetical protein
MRNLFRRAGLAARARHRCVGQSPPDLDTLIGDLVAANRILYRQGAVDGFGHVSVRHPARPDRFLMSASLAPGRVTKAETAAKPVTAPTESGRCGSRRRWASQDADAASPC